MSNRLKAILCFQRPEPGGYIGGLVTLCNDYIDKDRLFDENGVEISCFNYRLPADSIWAKIRNSKLKNICYGIKQIEALKKFLQKEPRTVVHIHTSRKALFFKDVLLAGCVRKYCKGKIIMTIHVGDIQTVFHNKYTRRYLIGKMNRSVDKVLFLSERMRQQFINVGLESNRTDVLYNFYNIKRVGPTEKQTTEVPHILFLGSINREKGIIELLEAAKAIKSDFHLDLCGTIIEESIREPFGHLLGELAGKVTYHGYIGKDKKEELLRQSEILVLPSYREGLPISILEALATSCGIVTTPVGAIPEILKEENAIIVPPRDAESLSNALEELLGDNDELKKMQSTNYNASVSFNDEAHIDKLCAIYQ